LPGQVFAAGDTSHLPSLRTDKRNRDSTDYSNNYREVSKYGGQLVLATTSDPRSFNPIIAKERSSTAITNLIFEGLTTTNGMTTEVEPNLSEGWEVTADGLSWIFHLRRDVQWFDGHPFTADDVVFTFLDLIYNEKIPSSARDTFTIDGKTFQVEKIDDFTVKFTLPVKFAPFLSAMNTEILPKHILKSIVDQDKFSFTWGIDSRPGDIIGTGPFMLKEYAPGERVVLVRNPHYWKKSKTQEPLPYLDRVVFMIVQSEDTVFLKFLDGELDYCSLRGMDYPLLKPEEKRRNFTLYDVGPDFGSNFIVFNLNTGMNPKTNKPYVEAKKLAWFSHINFRRAVAHAIDKQKIVEILMNGLGYSQDSAESPSAAFFYNPNVIKYEYDLAKAREILAKAGFVDRNGDGIIEDRQGHDIEFNFYTSSGANERVQIAAIVRSDLESLGMKINFLALEFNVLVGKLTSNYDWDAILIGLTGGIEPHFGNNVWQSHGQLHMWHPKQSSPATAWEKRIDEIFDAGVQELDPAKRKVLYDEWQVIASKELPLMYTVLGANIFAVRNKFGNLNPTSFGGAFHNLDEIYVYKEFR